ncbi:AraC family transcriptional regulator [Pseudomonas fluorescens]|uniref:AraC family transcriptional regulator n=1 Tax=Pseudomonas TaxID=286 RepID=UPI000CF32602|nr:MULTISPECIES: AraC family transcriptional regulator [Pseudomonas]MBD8238352.1 AraC family transcriptional regulator [Pseudomonas fluorescens]MBD8257399.1 AraC family transcriptional regulator [Pseudomonas fluorescens]MDY0895884.1 AraC family transcriptional regulator [Pseudomonas fluorescens]NJJ55140.1 AraC family transcriptional regulator [Pseudomonas sp. B14(2022)]
MNTQLNVQALPGSQPLPLSRHPLYSTSNLDTARSQLASTLLTGVSHSSKALDGFSLQFRDSPSDFEYTHNAVDLADISINAISYRAPVLFLNVFNQSDDYFLVLVLKGNCHVYDGEIEFDVRENDFFIFNINQTINAWTSPSFQEIVIRVSGARMRSAMRRMVDRSISIPLKFDSVASSVGAAGSSLARFVHLMCLEIDNLGSVFGSRILVDSYESMLVSLMLTLLPHNYSDWIACGVLPPAPYYVVRAERFILNHLRDPIGLDDIVQISGVGSRTLQRGFRRFRRLSPMAFLKECRLQYVRKCLRETEMRGRSISNLAREMRFEHSSKFSKAYSTRFNELPSETRRRSIDPDLP